MILCIAHRITGEEKYLTGAEQITDYIFGKNATGYCFLSGFGSKQVMFPHHRSSGSRWHRQTRSGIYCRWTKQG
jgi:endoglucanase